ncbi:hypothetical protein [Rhodoplanes sp. Z2-YC6860]|uniref:hypothetical protein n=1 Tax=Rhodoplanes sp. Z2-YC6860 TaxID=674703 RepID=UPI00078E7B51|nr:hypothetical protein [Rhodoplanes sp. Z2-YC6860]AMN43128.1 hypothetical protein RHPLAN_47020 [Rhodoplanes sp. Z2-YC6860]
MTRFGFAGLMVLGVALACHQSPANAQSDGARSDETANQGSAAERKVRVVLPSPYKQADIKPAKPVQPAVSTPAAQKAASTPSVIKPVATTPPQVAKPVIPVGESPSTKAPTPGQAVQASTNAAPAEPQAGSALRKPSKPVNLPTEKQVNAPSEDQATGEHDLNLASLADLNSLGGGMIGRAIIAGRPYHSPDELVTRRILSRATYSLIRTHISVRSSARY